MTARALQSSGTNGLAGAVGKRVALESLAVGERGRFVRVSDSDPALVRQLAERNVRPGDTVEMLAKGRRGRTVACTGRRQELPPKLMRAMRMEVER